MDKSTVHETILDYAKGISLVGFAGVLVIKIYKTPVNLTVDFPTLISLLLALFSVALSAMFYFKATDSSNAFYDNTYKFTKDIAELLIKIESGFGEKLRHLDEGYTSMRSHLENMSTRPSEDIEKTKQKIELEKQEVEKVLGERNQIVRQLIERSQLQNDEKERVLLQLKAKEDELAQSQSEISKLNRRLSMERMVNRPRHSADIEMKSQMSNYTFERIVKRIGVEQVLDLPSSMLRGAFEDVAKDLPRSYLRDLESLNFYDGALTPEGARYLKSVAEKHRGTSA